MNIPSKSLSARLKCRRCAIDCAAVLVALSKNDCQHPFWPTQKIARTGAKPEQAVAQRKDVNLGKPRTTSVKDSLQGRISRHPTAKLIDTEKVKFRHIDIESGRFQSFVGTAGCSRWPADSAGKCTKKLRGAYQPVVKVTPFEKWRFLPKSIPMNYPAASSRVSCLTTKSPRRKRRGIRPRRDSTICILRQERIYGFPTFTTGC
jgi:hypothetical protein